MIEIVDIFSEESIAIFDNIDSVPPEIKDLFAMCHLKCKEIKDFTITTDGELK